MIKTIKSSFLIFCWMATVPLSAQSWLWATNFGTSGIESLSQIEIDNDQSILAAGSFSQTLLLGDNSLPAIGSSDVYLSKLTSSGEVSWAVSGGSTSIDATTGLAISSDGHSYWCGQYWIRGIFAQDTIYAQSNSKAYFVARHDPDGNLSWLKNISGSELKSVNDLATDSEGNIWLTGTFSDSLLLEDTVLVATAEQDLFLLKLNADGQRLHLQHFGTSGQIIGQRIAIDSEDQPVLIGELNGSVTFAGDQLTSVVTDFDLWVAKFTSEGLPLWGRIGTGVFDNFARAIKIDANDHIFIAGGFAGVMQLSNSESILTPGNNENLFLLHYDTDGNILWARALDAAAFNDQSTATDIQVREGLIVMAGQFKGQLLLDEESITGIDTDFHSFLASFQVDNAEVVQLRYLPASEQIRVNQVAWDAENRLICGGNFTQNTSFGDFSLSSAGFTDIFLAQLAPGFTPTRDITSSIRQFSILPNPADNYLRISTTLDSFFIKISDLQGRMWITREQTDLLDISILPKGIYTLTLFYNARQESTLFIKK